MGWTKLNHWIIITHHWVLFPALALLCISFPLLSCCLSVTPRFFCFRRIVFFLFCSPGSPSFVAFIKTQIYVTDFILVFLSTLFAPSSSTHICSAACMFRMFRVVGGAHLHGTNLCTVIWGLTMFYNRSALWWEYNIVNSFGVMESCVSVCSVVGRIATRTTSMKIFFNFCAFAGLYFNWLWISQTNI